MAGKLAQPPEAALAPQQQVVSIRVSEELRFRLEKLRELIALKSGQTVTTSEAARQLLESARDDRLELANILTDPTDSLLVVRRKWDAKVSRTPNGRCWPITAGWARKYFRTLHGRRCPTNL